MRLRHRCVGEKGKTSFNNLAVVMLDEAIVLQCMRWSGEMGDTVSGEEGGQSSKFTNIIGVQGDYVLVKATFN